MAETPPILQTDNEDGHWVDVTPEVLDALVARGLRHWEERPDGSRHVAPPVLKLAQDVLGAWVAEVKAAHAAGDTARLDRALSSMQRDAGQMIASAACDAHRHHYAHTGKGRMRVKGQRLMHEDIAEQYRRSLAACRKSTAAALDTAETFGISERTVWRALKRLGVVGASQVTSAP
jgi:hypothetical protein